ncbi:unnamed protein product [Caenorhabditis brenneri]
MKIFRNSQKIRDLRISDVVLNEEKTILDLTMARKIVFERIQVKNFLKNVNKQVLMCDSARFLSKNSEIPFFKAIETMNIEKDSTHQLMRVGMPKARDFAFRALQMINNALSSNGSIMLPILGSRTSAHQLLQVSNEIPCSNCSDKYHLNKLFKI